MSGALSPDTAAEMLVSLHVNLSGSTAFPGARSVTLLLDASRSTFEQLRVMTAEFYGVAIEQVGEPCPTTREEYERNQNGDL